MGKKTHDNISLRVLYLEDSPQIVEIIRELLIDAEYDLSMDCTEKKNEFASLLRSNTYDVILSDFNLPEFDGFEALRLATDISPDVPFICVSGSINEETAIEIIRQGAVDYILKDRMLRLPSAIHRALDEATEKNARRRTEEALHESEDRYRNIVELSPDPIFVHAEGKIVYVNSAAVRLLGAKALDEIIGKPALDFVHPDDREVVLQRIQRIYREGLPSLNVEERFLRFDGTTIDVEVSSIPCTFSGKKAVQGVVRDITERKRTEEVLKKKEEKLIELFENAPVGYHELDERGTIIQVNRTELEILGYPSEKMIGWPVWEFVTNKEDSRKNVLGKLAGNLPPHKNHEQFFTRLDGTSFPALVDDVILRNEHGAITGIRSAIMDITERKHAEEALQESESRIRSLYENTTIGLYRTTPEGTILMANPALVTMLGYSSLQELTKRNLEKDGFEPPSQRKKFLEKINRDGEIHGHKSKWMCQDGTAIFVLESARAICDAAGKTLYFDGTVENISKRKLLEEKMRIMQKLEGLGTLAGGIAHDFNNILGIILSYITSIKRHISDTKKIDIAVEAITKAVERGTALVKQILTFARKAETKFEPVNLNDIVLEIMVILRETFPKILTFAHNLDKDISCIHADSSQMHQALLNLCVNARDAMPDGGSLTINTSMITGMILRHRHSDADASRYVCLEVRDTGEGMAPEIRNKIFEPFFTTKEMGKGTGLGLPVVFGVVQTHKGFVEVESERGKGTTFRLYLPASQTAEPISVKGEELLETIPGGRETVLVVEDEEMLMITLRTLLVEKGYSVLSAEDGLAAVNMYKERKEEIALVLTDLGLPKMGGMEVCVQIKKLNPNVRIILTTGYLSPQMKSKFLEAGIQHFLYKPYSLKKALNAVREVLDKK